VTPTVLALQNVQTGEAVTFWIIAPLVVLAALGMILVRSAVHSALLLAAVMLGLAVFYALEDAPFLAAVQIIVYTGAVMMLFLFVLMLVGVDTSDSLVETIRGQRVAAVVAGLAFVAAAIVALWHALDGVRTVGLTTANASGNPFGLAKLIFRDYVFPFEITSALLITAALGAMVLAHRERIVPRLTQREQSRMRFAGDRPSPLPGPGVFARHDSIETPALLPDGSVAPGSVSHVITEAGGDGGASLARTSLPTLHDIDRTDGEQP
jgi:NADH-quinone oxidoreductase subunit J